ncbi:unnamed protein product [Brugia timori]|uniref:Uncharacterized protein n=1 Tax=Brugia timori TaxID=42155 RepID=A0A0R3QQ32_9BILA|nr:unnamed protein product [Brugia timori]
MANFPTVYFGSWRSLDVSLFFGLRWCLYCFCKHQI